MSAGDHSEVNLDFGADNNFQNAIFRWGNIAGRDIITTYVNHDPHDVTLLRQLNPYLGLKSFTYDDRSKYAGRKNIVEAAVAQLTAPGDEQSFLLVTGASGSGKSSFVQAGVVPLLSQHYRLQNIVLDWDMFPPSQHPMAALTAALRRLGAAIPVGQVIRPSDWQRVLRETLPPRHLPCLVIDQFEEAFATHVDADERTAFFDLLMGLPSFAEFPIHIIATMRSDFLPDLFETALYPFAKHGVNLQTMDQLALEQAIERPMTHLMQEVERLLPEQAQWLGPKQWEGAVLKRLSADAAQDATYLPLLQVTLQDMWRNGHLKLSAYTDLTTAIQKRAETVWRLRDYDAEQQTPRTEAEQAAVMALLLDLVDVSLDDNARRAIRLSSTISALTANHPERHALIEDLVKARLLSKSSEDGGAGRTQRVDIIHESLLRNWPRLASAIHDQRLSLQSRARFRDDLVQWQISGHLLEGVRLATALHLAQNGDTVTQSENARALIQHSVAARDADQQARLRQAEAAIEAQRQRAETQTRLTRRTRRFTMVVLVLFVLSLGATAFAVNRQQVAQRNAQQIQQQLNIYESQRLSTLARSQSEINTEIGLLLGYEGLSTNDNSVSNIALRELLDREQWQPTTPPGFNDGTPVSKALFSPDGMTILATRSSTIWETTLQLWDRDGSLITTMQTSYMNSAVFSHDSSMILTSYDDMTAKLWTRRGEPITEIIGHTQAVWNAAFSPDDTTILTLSRDGTARLWTRDGSLITTFGDKDNPVRSAVFSPDGSHILAVSEDGTATLWKRDNFNVTLTGRSGSILNALFSPDGRMILVTLKDGTADLWLTDGYYGIATLTGHTEVISSAVFSPDGGTILTTSTDDTVRLWNTDGKPIAILSKEDHGDIQNAIFSPDSTTILIAHSDGRVKLWSSAGNFITTFRESKGVESAVFSPDGSTVLLATLSGIRLWTNTSLPIDFNDTAESAVFSPDGTTILTIARDNTARLWSRDGTPITGLIGHTDRLISASFSHDGETILTTSYDDTARLWTRDGAPSTTFNGPFHGITFSPDGLKILTAGVTGTVKLWDRDARLITPFRDIFTYADPGFSPDGKTLLMSEGDFTISLWTNEGTRIAVLKHTEPIAKALFSPDSATIVTLSNKTARLWTREGTLIATLSGHTEAIENAAFSPDGTTILTMARDNTVRLWQSDGTFITALIGHTDWVWSAEFNPDSTTIVTTSSDGTARLWTRDGTFITALVGHTDWVRSAKFSPDGTTILTTSGDGTARLWARDGTLITMLTGHTDSISTAVFNPDGKTILTTSSDGTARIHAVLTEDLLKLAACRIERRLTVEEKAQFSISTPKFVFSKRQCPPKLSWQN